jgi:hypothetical protein
MGYAHFGFGTMQRERWRAFLGTKVLNRNAQSSPQVEIDGSGPQPLEGKQLVKPWQQVFRRIRNLLRTLLTRKTCTGDFRGMGLQLATEIFDLIDNGAPPAWDSQRTIAVSREFYRS